MCGIYGITKIIPPELTAKKLKRIDFRGPDHSGFETVDNCVIGHNRLAIIDLDARSNQPFTYHHISLVFNGEIYNFKTLKSDLETKGYTFATSSDTEVLCAMYIEYGEECVAKLEGMFAFVIYDQKQKTMFGARDRYGQKPFYYSLENGVLEFCSQLAPITIDKNYTTSPRAISQYLLWKYIPEPESIYDEVKKLRAGYYFKYNPANHQFETKPYYTLSTKAQYQNISIEEAMNQLDSTFHDAVEKRLIADVPLGVFLSGGIDSSLVTAYGAEIYGPGLKTFSIKFNEKGFDESAYAESIAKHLKTDHQTITCDYREGLDLIENVGRYYTEPFSDASAIPSMLLSKHTRKHVTVALSGDAGDESFIGYDRYIWMNRLHNIYRLPYFLRKLLLSPLSLLPNQRYKLIASGLSKKSIGDAYQASMTSHSGGLLLDPSQGLSSEYQEYLHTNKALHERYSDYDIKTYMNGDINTKVDRASMAFSLEVRAPFLDHKIVELAKSIPLEYRLKGQSGKHILKELLAKKIPRTLFERPKRGFTMPFRDWFRNDLRDLVYDTITDESLSSIPNLDVKKAKLYIEEHMSGKEDRYSYIWSLLVLINWMKQEA